MKLSTLRRAVLWGFVLQFFWVGSPMAAERVTIAQLQKYRAFYHLHSVTLVGTVHAMQVFPPLPTFESDRCSPVYGLARFELVDDSGSLPVETLGSCFPAAMELPRDGDLIELTAMIQVFVPEGRTERVIKAVTQNIVVLKPASQEPRSEGGSGLPMGCYDERFACSTGILFARRLWSHDACSRG